MLQIRAKLAALNKEEEKMEEEKRKKEEEIEEEEANKKRDEDEAVKRMEAEAKPSQKGSFGRGSKVL